MNDLTSEKPNKFLLVGVIFLCILCFLLGLLIGVSWYYPKAQENTKANIKATQQESILKQDISSDIKGVFIQKKPAELVQPADLKPPSEAEIKLPASDSLKID